MGEMEELLARVDKATGPDRDLDARLWCLGEGVKFSHLSSQQEAVIFFRPGAKGSSREDGWTQYTASLDASLALVDQVLPGWEIRATLHDPHVRMNNRAHTIDVGALGATPALALIAACLRALIKDQSNG